MIQLPKLKLNIACSLPDIHTRRDTSKASTHRLMELYESVLETGKKTASHQSAANRRKQIAVQENERLHWFKSRGKQKLQMFSNEQIAQLKNIFKTLDSSKRKYLYPEQLYQPFIILGLVSNYDQLISVVEQFDDNKNGKIELGQFLNIAKECLETEDLERVKAYFHRLLNGQNQKRFKSCFGLYFQKKRREMIMRALRGIVDEPASDSLARGKSQIAKIIREVSKLSLAQKCRS